nr:hypothetical protein [Paraburkholderia aromaticivorans]
MSEQPSIIEIESAPSRRFAVILMHGLGLGLGADANDFVSLRLSYAPASTLETLL